MKFKKLEISSFKSFFDKTHFFIEDGLTGQNFNYTGLALRVAYAKQVTDRLKLGGNFR